MKRSEFRGAILVAGVFIFSALVAAQNQGGTVQNPSAAGNSATDANHPADAPPDLPPWAYPINPQAGRGRGAGGGPPAAAPPEDTTLLHVPGSDLGFTKTYIANLFTVPDWFPASHPPMPPIVATGNRAAGAQACGYCHLPNGQGRPENQSVVGLPAGYALQQLSDFKNGSRKSSEPRMGPQSLMVRIAKALSDDDAKAAADYFASIKPKQWIRVVESDTVPMTHPAGGLLVRNADGGTEPIGHRIIELAEDQNRFELRDPNAGFVAYVPMGSIQKGKEMVATGGGKTIPCGICHGQDLKGVADIPSLAGRSPSQIVRQIIDIQTGSRNGPNAALMKPVVSKLTLDDEINIAAYLSSLQP